VAGFVEYAGRIDASWRGSAAMSAAEFLRLDGRRAARTSIEGRASPEGIGPERVVVTLDGLADDSVRAERWILTFAESEGEYTLTSARRVQRCQRGRGHEDFSPSVCV
jgi:hypothetical protein